MQGLAVLIDESKVNNIDLNLNIAVVGSVDVIGSLTRLMFESSAEQISCRSNIKIYDSLPTDEETPISNESGGLAGRIYDSTLRNSYSIVNVESDRPFGGLAGSVADLSTNQIERGFIC